MSSSFDLRSASASREGAFKQLLLLEQHLSAEACHDCVHKHLFTAIAYLEEAKTLAGGEAADARLAEELRRLQPSVRASAQAAASVRRIRKRIAERLGFGFVDENDPVGAVGAVGSSAANGAPLDAEGPPAPFLRRRTRRRRVSA